MTFLPLSWLDFHARWYDPVLACWHVPDPLAAQTPHESPYAYCGGNPVNYTDPTGMEKHYRGPTSFTGDHGWGFGDMSMFTNDESDGNGGGGGSESRSDYGLPGCGDNGPGLYGIYYDWESSSYRSTRSLARIDDPEFIDYYSAISIDGGKTWKIGDYLYTKIKPSGQGGGSLPDWTKISPAEKIRYILNAGAASQTKQVNIHNIFKNYTPYCDGSSYGSDLLKPVNVTLGGRQYKVAMTIGVLTDVNGKYNPVFDISINDPKTINTKYGKATGYNYGHRSQMYLLIYGNDDNAEAFEDWYGF